MEEVKWKNEPKKVFILNNDSYEEITYTQFKKLKNTDPAYINRYYIPIQGYLLEVSEKQYIDYYKDSERQKYLHKKEKQAKVKSLDTIIDEMNGNMPSTLYYNNTYETVETKMLTEKLLKAISVLEEEEKTLIVALFYKGISERSFSKASGIPQKTINYRKHKLLKKLKNLINN